MKLQLEQAVPRGMLLADAYETMRRRGCCEPVKAGVWRQWRRMDFLRYVRDDGQVIKRRGMLLASIAKQGGRPWIFGLR